MTTLTSPQWISSTCNSHETRLQSVMRRIGQIAGGLFLVLCISWTDRESTHGLAAFWEHWWCPIPLALILLGLVTVITTRRTSSAA